MLLRIFSWPSSGKRSLRDLGVRHLTGLLMENVFSPQNAWCPEPPLSAAMRGGHGLGELCLSYLLIEYRKEQKLLQLDAPFRNNFYLVERLYRLLFLFILYHIEMSVNIFKLFFLGSYNKTTPNVCMQHLGHLECSHFSCILKIMFSLILGQTINSRLQ